MDSSSLGLATFDYPKNSVLCLARMRYMLDDHGSNPGLLMLLRVLFCRMNAFKRCVMNTYKSYRQSNNCLLTVDELNIYRK
jgi:hypothetical protein